LHVYPIYRKDGGENLGDKYISSISDVIERGKTSLTGLFPEEAAALAETFRKVPLLHPPPTLLSVSDAPGGEAIPGSTAAGLCSDPWTRLLAHALLRESRIFPGLGLCDKPPYYTPLGFTDIWKGEYHGEPVCVKVVRGQRLTSLREVDGVWRPFYSVEGVLSSLVPDIPPHYRSEQAQFSSKHPPRHPGFGGAVSVLYHEPMDARWEHYPVYPSEPRCRSTDACTCPPAGIGEDNLLTSPVTACTSVRRSHAPSRVGYFTRQY